MYNLRRKVAFHCRDLESHGLHNYSQNSKIWSCDTALGFHNSWLCTLDYNISFNMAKITSEQRVYPKIRAQLGYPSWEINVDLQKIHGKDAIKLSAVCTSVGCFKDGRQSIGNGRKVGRPCFVVPEKILPPWNHLWTKMLFIVQEIADITGIFSSSIFKILHERLGLWKVCARWALICSQKNKKKLGLGWHHNRKVW